MIGAAELVTRFALYWEPPGQISTSEWADKYMRLSPETSAKPGKWTTRAYQREPMDACSDPTVRKVVIDAATQLIKTSVIKAAIARIIDVDPGPIMVLQPRNVDVTDFCDGDIAPMIRDVERLRGKIALTRNGKTPKRFHGGRFIVTSAGSAANVAGKSIRYLFADEVNKYVANADDEGNPVSLARKRLTTYKHRAKEIETCSPTIAGSEIDRAYEASDQREYFIPCPHCGGFQSLMKKFFSQVRWDETLETKEEQAASAAYYCQFEECQKPWTDGERNAAVERGEWRAAKPFNGVAGFSISELYSPDRRMSEIVLDYLSKKDDVQDLRTFYNTSLAENYGGPGEMLDWQTVAQEHQEDYPIGSVPKRGVLLVAGADVHPDRIEMEMVAYGPRRESWSIAYHIFEGRTSELKGQPGQPSPWELLEAEMGEVYLHEGGGELTLSHLFIDYGNQRNDVLQWVARQDPHRVTAIKGSDTGKQVGDPKETSVVIGGRVCGKLRTRMVCVSAFKEQFYADLAKRRPTKEQIDAGWRLPEGYCHFPKGVNYGDEHFKQVCSEKKIRVRKRGRLVEEWEPQRTRNEALDCRIYAMACAWYCLLGNWHNEARFAVLRARLGPQQEEFCLEGSVADVSKVFAASIPLSPSAPVSAAAPVRSSAPRRRPFAHPLFSRRRMVGRMAL